MEPSSLAVAAPAAGVLYLLILSSSAVGLSAAAVATAPVPVAAAPVPVPVRMGVVLDLTSNLGRKNLAYIFAALDNFYLEHPSYTKRLELRVRDSRGDAILAAHAAGYLIKNARVQAIILGLQTSTKPDLVASLGSRNHIPVLSFTGVSAASCAFWLQDPFTASRGHGKICFKLGKDNITFLDTEINRRNVRKLETTNSRNNCKGQNDTMLRIVVPQKQGFQDFVTVTHPNSDRQMVTGYSIDVFETAISKLDPRPCYEFFAFDGSYDELVGTVSSGVYDGAVGDVTITAKRVADTDFTMPYTPSGVSMLVLGENKHEMIQWTFLRPLNGQLWLVIWGFFFYTGFVVWMVEGPRNQEYQGSILRQCSTAFYFIFSTLTFSHGQVIRSPLSKTVVVIWCFAVLILVQSYTASYSSILTAKRLQPVLDSSNTYVGYQYGSSVVSILLNFGVKPKSLRAYAKKEEYADALRKGSKNGGVSAIIDEIPYLTSILSDPRYQNEFKMIGPIYDSPGFGFPFRLGFPLLHNLSAAILNLTGGGEGPQIKTKWFPLPTGEGTVHDTDSAPLTVQTFSGLFVITGSISTLTLLISIVRLVHAKCTRARTPDAQSVDDDSGDEESLRLQNGVGDDSVPSQPLPEATNNNSLSLHGSDVENAGNEDGEPCSVQRNGREPAESLQIEISNF